MTCIRLLPVASATDTGGHTRKQKKGYLFFLKPDFYLKLTKGSVKILKICVCTNTLWNFLYWLSSWDCSAARKQAHAQVWPTVFEFTRLLARLNWSFPFLAFSNLIKENSVPKQPTRFYPAVDIVLLKDGWVLNPYAKEKNNNEWEWVEANVNSVHNGQKVSLWGCKNRMRTLLKAHRKAEMISLQA